MIEGINGHRAAIVIRDRSAPKRPGGPGRVEAGMRRVENQSMANLVMRDRIEIVRFVSQVARGQPVIIVSEQQPAESIVVAINLGFESAGALDSQRYAVTALHWAAVASLTARAMRRVGGAVGVKLVAAIAVCVNEEIAAAEIVRPDIGAFRSDSNEVEIHAAKKVRPIAGSLSHQGEAHRIGKEAREVAVEIGDDFEVIGAL